MERERDRAREREIERETVKTDPAPSPLPSTRQETRVVVPDQERTVDEVGGWGGRVLLVCM